MAESFPISGNIDPEAFPFLLMDLHHQGATGSLKVDGPSYQKALYFRGGRILFGSSNDPRDQLGAILIESGRITPEQLEEVNAKVGSGNPLAKVLAESGFVSQRELGEAARAKVERILSDLIAYEAGSFEFEDGVLPKGAVDLKLSTERLVLAAVRRMNDRGFVLRHLSGLNAVLAPTGTLSAALPEIHTDAAGLPEALDGRRSLKEAAAHARLDEFEAAKIACGLLFLGLAKAAKPATRAGGLELDLGQTARMAFDDEPAAPAIPAEPPTIIMDASPEPESAPTGSETGFAFVESSDGRPGGDSEPIVIDAETPLDEAPTLLRPGPAPLAAPPLVEPPRAAAPPRPPVPASIDAGPARPAPARPSKDDLAALDALLNSRSVEGPMVPMERPAPTWEPRFGQPSARSARAAGGGLRVPIVAAGLLLLLGGAGAAWVYFGRGGPAIARDRPSGVPASSAPPTTLAAIPSPAPTLSPTPPQPQPSEPPGPTEVASPAAPSVSPSAQAPPPAPAPGASLTLADARSLLRQGRLAEAANGFATNLRESPPGSYSIQLLVACATETVDKALSAVAAPDLYILPVNYKGRPCFRVCWGLYDSQERADSAARSVPEYFRKGGSSPRVLPAAGLLP